MEKKDWKKKLRELSFMKGYYFKLEDNGLVEKKDDQLVFNREELERFVQQELDKAREEGKGRKLQGWECPKCGSVYSPLTFECPTCKNSGIKVRTSDRTSGYDNTSYLN